MTRHNLGGLLAVLFWSCTIAFSRTLSEPLGPLTAGSLTFLLAGALGLAAQARRPGGIRGMLSLPRRYLLGCGALFVLYELLLYVAVGLAASRTQVLAVGLANYLWPSLTLLFSLFFQPSRPNFWLVPGIGLALGGTWLAVWGDSGFSTLNLLQTESLLPVALAALAAVLWGLYSNLTRLWSRGEGSAVPLFLLASGAAALPLRFLTGEVSSWQPQVLPALLFMAIFPAWLGYRLWDDAMQHGDLVLVTAVSYSTPIFSTLMTLVVLQVPFTWTIGLAALLVMGGAILSKAGINEKKSPVG